ncbi:MAG: hypothetical protein HYY13_02680 [Nitrospirae bacterium]|nr:hypothetical protein [Nitrospirota bacterium]
MLRDRLSTILQTGERLMEVLVRRAVLVPVASRIAGGRPIGRRTVRTRRVQARSGMPALVSAWPRLLGLGAFIELGAGRKVTLTLRSQRGGGR